MLQSSIALMKNNVSLLYNFFLVVGDFLALTAAFGGAYVLRVTLDARPLVEAIPAVTYLGVFLTLLPFWIIIFALLGLYNTSIYEKRFAELGRLIVGSFIGLLFVVFIDFVLPRAIFPARLVPLYGFGLALVFVVLFRNIARMVRSILFSYGIGLTRTLIVGDTSVSNELIEAFRESSSGYKVVGVVGTNRWLTHVPVYKTFEGATKALKDKTLHSIIQTELYSTPEKNNSVLTYAQENHVAYRFIPGNTELFVGNIDVELFRSAIPVIAVHQTPLLGWGRVAKRVFDIIVSSLALVILSPLFVLISLLIIIFSPGKIIFRQRRLTRFGTPFKIYKFRTTKRKYTCSPERGFKLMGRPDLLKLYRENGDYLPHDPRFTLLGRLLRKTSLDELPQLINVFKGDLSLVGPRALVPEEINIAEAKHHILSVKSGITGLAQVSGRREITVDERRKLDLYYIQNWTFWLDITIILKTFRALITRG